MNPPSRARRTSALRDAAQAISRNDNIGEIGQPCQHGQRKDEPFQRPVFPANAGPWVRHEHEHPHGPADPSPEPVVGEPETFGLQGVMIPSVLGPRSGDWILVVDDDNDTFVGSRSARDIVRLESIFGSGKDEATAILAKWEAMKPSNQSWLREWLPAALEHILGPAEAADLLAEEGRWLAEL